MEHKSQQLLEYLAICQSMYERMERDGTWPWRQGDEHGDMVSPRDNVPEPDTSPNMGAHTCTKTTAKNGVNQGKEANDDSTLSEDLVESEDNSQIV